VSARQETLHRVTSKSTGDRVYPARHDGIGIECGNDKLTFARRIKGDQGPVSGVRNHRYFEDHQFAGLGIEVSHLNPVGRDERGAHLGQPRLKPLRRQRLTDRSRMTLRNYLSVQVVFDCRCKMREIEFHAESIVK